MAGSGNRGMKSGSTSLPATTSQKMVRSDAATSVGTGANDLTSTRRREANP